MDKTQKNKLSMFERVDSYLTEKASEYADNQELTNSASGLKSKCGEIRAKDEERINSTTFELYASSNE